jgi:hypothetical protein
MLVGVCEAVLRFGMGLGNPILIEPDQSCSYVVKPDQSVFRFFHHTRINHYGMRSDEVSPVRSPGTLRIMFVGDSLTYGTSRVDQSQIFTERLHRDLPSIVHRPVEVLNASASAWAPDNEVSYILSRGIYQSDIVILVLNDGDVGQPRSTIADVGDDLPQYRPASAIGELYSRYISPVILHTARHGDAGSRVAANDGSAIRENLADLDRVEKYVIDAGARLVIVYLPFRGDIPGKDTAPREILRAWTAAHRVVMFNLESAELPYSSNEITLEDGVHFNAKGHWIIAQAIENLWPDLVGH